MSSITANERQVGGDHYKTGAIEHWDVVHDADVPYLLAVASKYVARHHLKAGREDLEKAIHYQEKWLEKRIHGEALLARSWRVGSKELLRWCVAAELQAAEVRVLYTMLCARGSEESLQLTRELLEQRYPAKKGKVESMTTLSEQIAREYSGPLKALGPGTSEHEPDWTHPVHHRPGTPEDGGHHARQPEEATDSGDETEVIRHYDIGDILTGGLPDNLSQHEYQHRCDRDVQACYHHDNSASRWILNIDAPAPVV